MRVNETSIAGVLALEPERHHDRRGFLSETWSRARLARHGIAADFVQENHSLSRERFTLRGLHFQVPPHAQAKLVRVLRGAVLDVAVDLRRDSPSFGRHVAAVLSAAAWNQLYVPAGFAHGFCTLEPDSEVLYKVTAYYAPEAERGLHFADPALGIAWPMAAEEALLNARDDAWPRLAELADELAAGAT